MTHHLNKWKKITTTVKTNNLNSKCPNCGEFKLSSSHNKGPIIIFWFILGMVFSGFGIYSLFLIFSILIPIFLFIKWSRKKSNKVDCSNCGYVGYLE